MSTPRRDTYTPETLLSVAVAVFNERGYDGTSMEHLSKAAGISKSSIYHHVVGKEELLGMLAAVEWSLAQDETALLEGYEGTVQAWLAGLRDRPGVSVERGYPSEAGQPHARAIVRFARFAAGQPAAACRSRSATSRGCSAVQRRA